MATTEIQKKSPVAKDLDYGESQSTQELTDAKSRYVERNKLREHNRVVFAKLSDAASVVPGLLASAKSVNFVKPYVEQLSRDLEDFLLNIKYAAELGEKTHASAELVDLEVIAVKQEALRAIREEKVEAARADARRAEAMQEQSDAVALDNFESQVNVEVLRAAQKFAAEHDRQPSERELKELRQTIRERMLGVESRKPESWASRLMRKRKSQP